jgi:hypothetical protein
MQPGYAMLRSYLHCGVANKQHRTLNSILLTRISTSEFVGNHETPINSKPVRVRVIHKPYGETVDGLCHHVDIILDSRKRERWAQQ